jgi:hypothetical protein
LSALILLGRYSKSSAVLATSKLAVILLPSNWARNSSATAVGCASRFRQCQRHVQFQNRKM